MLHGQMDADVQFVGRKGTGRRTGRRRTRTQKGNESHQRADLKTNLGHGRKVAVTNALGKGYDGPARNQRSIA
jgi:hypothetical protein